MGAARGVDYSRQEAGAAAPLNKQNSSGNAYPPGTLGDHYDLLKGFFGTARNKSRDLRHTYEHEFMTRPDGFTDGIQQLGLAGSPGQEIRNGHIETVLLEKTVSHQCYPITRMAPWKHHGTSLEITWSTLNFHQHVLDKLPELSMPRLMSQSEQGGKAALARFGIAMLMEATFAETQRGMRTYTMQIEQMKVATITTVCLAILTCLLTHTPYEYNARTGIEGEAPAKSARGIDEMFKQEKQITAIMNKPDGAAALIEICKMRLRSRPGNNTEGDFQVIPSGSARALNGTTFQQFVASDYADDEAVERSKTRETIIQSSPFSQGHGQKVVDVFKRARAFGAVATMSHSVVANQRWDLFRIAQLGTTLYSRDTDGMHHADYTSHYKYTGYYRFGEAGAPMTLNGRNALGRGWINDLKVHTWGQAQRKFFLPQMKQTFIKCIMERCKSPAKKREFLNSLRLLKPNAPELTSCKGLLFPDESTFNMKHIVARGNDRRFEDTPTVADYRDYMNNPSNPRTSTKRSAQIVRRVIADARVDNSEMSAEELFEANKLSGYAPHQVEQKKRYEVDGDNVMEVTNHNRNVLPIVRRFRAPKPSAAAQDAAKKGIAELTTELADAKYAAATADWVAAINAAKGFTDEEKLQRLTELKSCTLRAYAWTNSQGKQPEFKSLVDKLFSNIASAYDLDAALRIATGDVNRQLRIETVSIEAGTAHGHFSNEVKAHGRWTPDVPAAVGGVAEDGQISLKSRFPSSASNFSLPTDTFATTLSQPGRVALFDTDSSASAYELCTRIDPELRKERRVAMQWSIIVSHFISDQFKNLPADGPAVATALDVLCVSMGWSAAAAASAAVRAAFVPQPPNKKLLAELVAYGTNILPTKVTDHVLPLSQEHYHSLVGGLNRALLTKLKTLDVAHPPPAAALLAINTAITDGCKLVAEQGKLLFGTLAANAAGVVAARSIKVLTDQDISDQLEADARNAAAAAKAAGASAAALPAVPDVPERAPDVNELQWNEENVLALIDRASITSGSFWSFCVENDLPVPFDLKIWRPRMTFLMGATLRMQAGMDGAARTFYQAPHFMAGADAGPKLIYGHYTVHFKPLVLKPERIIVIPDVHVSKYLGGNGLAINDPLNEDHKRAWAEGRGADIFVTAHPQTDHNKLSHSWCSITGKLPSHIPHDQDVARMLHYPGCDDFARYWGFNGETGSNDGPYNPNTSLLDLNQNVMCFQDFQIVWSPTGGGADVGTFSKYILSEGHFGKYACYAGSADVTSGIKPVFSMPAYAQTMGA